MVMRGPIRGLHRHGDAVVGGGIIDENQLPSLHRLLMSDDR
jgi:hypothetical protein